ncbi:hypothetical protein FZC66_14515 [Priestia megaterium]|nr:hypothetical protein FZC66_14515 [Priestia megaterium]
MKNHRYLLKDSLKAEDIAKDLKIQLEVNRLHTVNVFPIAERNEVIVQVADADGTAEDIVDAFMNDYKTGEMLE